MVCFVFSGTPAVVRLRFGRRHGRKCRKTAAVLAESMLNAPGEPIQRFGSILEGGEESLYGV